MPKYRINPAGVETTLKLTSSAAKKFEPELKPMDGHFTSAASACGGSGAIVPALNTFLGYENKNLTAMVTRLEACITGAAAATTAYVEGDYDMMRTYQTNAAQAKISKIPKHH